MVLHGYWRSGCSWRVRIALNMKGFTDDQVEHKFVHLVKNGGEQHSEEYKAMNPSELVPTLEVKGGAHGDLALSESMPICEYLEEVYPNQGAPLLPKDPVSRW